jgi:diaminopropionate ammonia-lyase
MLMSRYFINSKARSDPAPRGLFEDEEYRLVDEFFCSQPRLNPTPLRHLKGLACALKLDDILLKDESTRFGLNSFKILGVMYAIGLLLRENRIAHDRVLVCASEGNHGRAVAHVAAMHKLKAKVYVAANTSPVRIKAIEREGAAVVIADGNYDDAVNQCARDAEAHGWQIISDTSWPGYEEIPRLIMAGYTRLMGEAEAQWLPESTPDLVLVQAGVGGLACAVVSWLCQRYGARRPFVIVCEPTAAPCLLESARAGKPVTLHGTFDTIMAGLRCGAVSDTAWPTIAVNVDAFVSVDDEQCAATMRKLLAPGNGDPVIMTGGAGACGMSALLAILHDDDLLPLREAGGLGRQSRVLIINTEGPTDP